MRMGNIGMNSPEQMFSFDFDASCMCGTNRAWTVDNECRSAKQAVIKRHLTGIDILKKVCMQVKVDPSHNTKLDLTFLSGWERQNERQLMPCVAQHHEWQMASKSTQLSQTLLAGKLLGKLKLKGDNMSPHTHGFVKMHWKLFVVLHKTLPAVAAVKDHSCRIITTTKRGHRTWTPTPDRKWGLQPWQEIWFLSPTGVCCSLQLTKPKIPPHFLCLFHTQICRLWLV